MFTKTSECLGRVLADINAFAPCPDALRCVGILDFLHGNRDCLEPCSNKSSISIGIVKVASPS